MRYSLDMYSGADLKHLLVLNDQMPDEYHPAGLGIEASLERFRLSSWGLHQSNQPPRYAGSFAYDVDNNSQRMIEDLGEAVHPIEHNIIAHHDYQGFLLDNLFGPKPLDVSPRDIIASRLGVTWHDTGETTHPDLHILCGSVVGDIPSGEKTDANRIAERRVLEKCMELLLPDVSDEIRGFAINLITHDPVVKDHPLHTLSEVSHNWGEYQTGLIAGHLAVSATRAGETGERVRQLSRIAAVVLPKVKARLIPAIPDNDLVERLLNNAEPQHNALLSELGELHAI